LDKNFIAAAITTKPKTTFKLFIQPPDLGIFFNTDGNNAKKKNGAANTPEKPTIPIIG